MESRLDRAQEEGLKLRDWSRWWARRGRDQLGLILWSAWDPIGQGVPRDEYDGHALSLAKQLRTGRSANEVARWLASNSPLDPGATTEVAASDHAAAAKVVEWYADEMARWGQSGDRS